MCQRILSFVLLVVCSAGGGIWSDIRKPSWIPQKYANTKGCYINKVSRVVPYGETIQVPGYCYVMKCTPYGITYNACGVELTDDIDCDFKNIRFFKTYPECCANINCLQRHLKRVSRGELTSENQQNKVKPHRHLRKVHSRPTDDLFYLITR